MSNLATLMRRHNELDEADFSKQAGVPFITHTLCNVVWRKDTSDNEHASGLPPSQEDIDKSE